MSTLTTTLTTLPLPLLLLATLASAAALPASPVTPRACARVFPLKTSRISLISRPDLDFVHPQTLVFSLPSSATSSGAGPCTLRARFPPHWEVFDSRVDTGGAPLAVDVYAKDGPAAGSLAGTVRFAAPAGTDRRGVERTVVINSFACRETMTFGLVLAEGESGEVGFVNGLDKGLGVVGGVEMVVGC